MRRTRSAHATRVSAFAFRAACSAILVGALIACGPSFQALYEGDARFEHCYALEEDGVASMQKKADCWRDWTDHYTYGQTRDRVQYASMRYRALTSSALPTDEGMMSAAPGEAEGQNGTALAPTNAFAPPPTTAAATPSSTPKSTWMTTAPQNMEPDQGDAGATLVMPTPTQSAQSGPVPSASQDKPTSGPPKKKK
jgi:hypothetical protein